MTSTFRFKSKDSMGNIEYLVVTQDRVYMTNPSMTPLALSNSFRDAALLTFAIQDALLQVWKTHREGALALLFVVNKYASYGRVWEVL